MVVSILRPTNFLKVCIIIFCIGITDLAQAQIQDTVYVEMAAINQPFMYNRLGAAQPTGMVFALISDLDTDITYPVPGTILGKVRLRSDKRPRPIVLRANKGNILKIKFTNLLAPYNSNEIVNAYGTAQPGTVDQSQAAGIYPMTRAAGVHILGTEMANNISSDGSWSGANDSSLANPGETKEYIVRVPEEGTFMLYSTGATVAPGGQAGGQLTNGLFGTLNVQPEGAEWYRSQVTEEDLDKTITHYEQLSEYANTPNIRVKKSDVSNIYDMERTFPIIDYNKKDANGKPILKMYTEQEHADGSVTRTIVHTDLTAIITGPDAGDFTGESPSFFEVPASPDRRRPYREFGIHYHESPWTVQAFPIFYQDNNFANKFGGDSLALKNTLATGKDNFSINYGSGGIGAEIYANRIGVGPMADCDDCAYEEFFLSSWSVGDPSTIVDIPANSASITAQNVTQQNQFLKNSNPADSIQLEPLKIPKAKKVLYPDDPSNVYHSYMNDHVKFRVTHAGAGLTHVHHQHAHQWLHSPNSDEGHYLDSQTINPGSSYTLEMVYNGSGNLNKTVGDQIFHCHFYPHFAQGMWAMWRVHDVLELGTKLDANGIAASNSRALPDGEISAGTPIPGLVPIPKRAMAPVPSKIHIEDGEIVIDDLTRNPGFPFFIPGVSGSRPPHPPLDFAKGAIYNAVGDSIGYGPLNGGLPRNVIYQAAVPFENHTPYDWTKIIEEIEIIELPEDGTEVEKVAMATHAIRNHATMTPEGDSATFILNGLPPVSGAPFADPAVDLNGNKVGTKRTYKAANIQLDVVLNKKGWHYPQQRIISLWGDVSSNIQGEKPPEPFYFRANSREYIEFWHTNLIPEYYELDDYQVRTPTDIIGQHIHLVKFDVTSSDGAANGWNYEDGTLAPDMVTHRIDAINDGGKRYTYVYQPGKPITDVASYSVNENLLTPHEPNPIWGNAPEGQDWKGAQTTIQRWYSDPLLNNRGEDRTLRTVFTHDHFGPSTHQQIGLYAGLLIEPFKSRWINPITGEPLGIANNGVKRPITVNGMQREVSDGGPTSWQANIITENTEESYREFMLEFQDTQQAYLPDSRETPDVYPKFPKDYSGQAKVQFIDSVNAYTGWMDPDKVISNQAYPELVSFGFRGTYSMNYRNEPLPLRASTPNASGNYTQAPNPAGNLAYVYSSMTNRADPAFNTQPVGGFLIPGSNTFRFPVNPIGAGMQPGDPYTPLFRAYENDKIQIRTLVGAHVTSHFFNVHGVNWLFEPSNQNSGLRSTQNMGLSEHFEMNFQLPVTDKTVNTNEFTDYLYEASADATGRQAGLWGLMRAYDTAQTDIVPLPNNNVLTDPIKSLPKNCGCPAEATKRTFNVTAISVDQLGGVLVYNERFGNKEDDAIVFIKDEQLASKTWKQEPLVLRANAGECVVVNLTNKITKGFQTNPGTYSYKSKSGKGISTSLVASSDVGLHAELLSYDVGKNDGANIGLNQSQTVSIGNSRTYEWYAGKWQGNTPIPVEFGSVVLSAPDPLEQYVKGLFGALIIEPEGTTWVEDINSSHSANIYDSEQKLLFREFVMQFQDNITVATDSTDTAGFGIVSYALNYRSEPMQSRLPDPKNNNNLNTNDLAGITSNDSSGDGYYPATPHFIAKAGVPLRLRLLHPGGNGKTETFNLHGHIWQEEPYTDNSTQLGYNDTSQWFGFRDQVGPLNSFDLLINSAGGDNKVTGDYLYSSMLNQSFNGGIWGIMTVTDDSDYLYVENVQIKKGKTAVSGIASVDPSTGKLPEYVLLKANGKQISKKELNPNGTGSWEFKNISNKTIASGFEIVSSEGAILKADKKSLERIEKSNRLISKVIQKRIHPLLQEAGVKPDRVESKKVKMN
ncbi:copper oxidase [Aquimarina sp. RZ0]|uniref:copper oxidase n=1 Tax=Aquimarina sp. RZ0 TaxID=2607730 RepID=UPI0011F2E7F2|nr:copper oxidase [Aquimarina sp. RZ0]KAA1246576.1 copper oxidase [Aquimarina sp. RZ0]